MRFYELQERLAVSPADLDLSTGAPLLFAELQDVLRAGVRELGQSAELELVLSSYEQLDGLERFRDEIAGVMAAAYGRPVSRGEVLATAGVQAALRYVHRWLARDRRRALYPMAIEFPGCIDPTAPLPPAVGPYRTETAGSPGVCRPVLEAGVSQDWDGVGAAILSCPHSPTGRNWDSGELAALAAAAADHDALLVLDETYAPPFAPVAAEPRPPVDAPNVVHLFSLSKLGLAGERVGVAVAHADVIRELARLQRSFIIQPPKAGQFLALRLLRAFRSDPELRISLVDAYRHRWERCRATLAELAVPGLRIGRWEGGVFAWLEWDDHPDDVKVIQDLLAKGIAVAPGSALKVAPEHPSVKRLQGLRIGLGAPVEALETAVGAAGAAVAAGRGA
jgi:valine--pyruvate aminotransferase